MGNDIKIRQTVSIPGLGKVRENLYYSQDKINKTDIFLTHLYSTVPTILLHSILHFALRNSSPIANLTRDSFVAISDGEI